jgi:hypothetical protein
VITKTPPKERANGIQRRRRVINGRSYIYILFNSSIRVSPVINFQTLSGHQHQRVLCLQREPLPAHDARSLNQRVIHLQHLAPRTPCGSPPHALLQRAPRQTAVFRLPTVPDFQFHRVKKGGYVFYRVVVSSQERVSRVRPGMPSGAQASCVWCSSVVVVRSRLISGDLRRLLLL